MDFEIDTSGFDELKGKLEELDGSNRVTLPELFPQEFMENYTEFEDIEKFLEKSGLQIESREKFIDISDDFIKSSTQFEDSEDMLTEGYKKWAKEQMDL